MIYLIVETSLVIVAVLAVDHFFKKRLRVELTKIELPVTKPEIERKLEVPIANCALALSSGCLTKLKIVIKEAVAKNQRSVFCQFRTSKRWLQIHIRQLC